MAFHIVASLILLLFSSQVSDLKAADNYNIEKLSNPKPNSSFIVDAINFFREPYTTNEITVLVAIFTVLGVLVAFIYAGHRGKLAKAHLNQIMKKRARQIYL